MILHIENKNQFEENINKGLVLVDFFATWCGPCKMISPLLEEISEEKDLLVLKVDVDQNNDLAAKFNIQAVPTLMIFKDGELKETRLGYQNKNQLLNFINK